jgi:DNA modification methylase
MNKFEINKIYCGDCREVLKTFPDESVNCCVTSPPYWGLRDYGVKGQLGLEKTPEEYIKNMVEVFREVKRVLRSDGTLWLNLGDSYLSNPKPDIGDQKYMNGRKRFDRPNTKKILNLKPKNLVGIPWRVALALQADGWYLRQDIIWSKPNPMPESVTDRCTKSHEYIFLLSKSARYYYDNGAIKEPVGIKGNANSFRGGAYCNGNKDNSLLGKRTVSGNTKIKVPSGWDTSKGSHGNYHKDGRGNPEYKTNGKHSKLDKQSPGRRMLENVKKARSLTGDHEKMFGTKRNKRSVWTVATYPYKKAHFATFPPKLIEPCILAGCPKDGIVLDPFLGSGTTGFVARANNKNYLGIDLSSEYITDIAQQRILSAEPKLF